MIKTITKEQEAEIPKYIKKWIDLASQPIDRSKIKDIFLKIYGKEKLIVIGESFQNTIDLIRVATEGKELEYDSQLNNQLRNQLNNQLHNQLNNQLHNRLNNQLNNQLHNRLNNQLYNQLYDQIYNRLNNQLYNQLYDQIYNQLHNRLNNQLYNQLYNQLRSQNIKYSYYVSYYLQDWAGYYDYAKSIGVKFDEESLQQYFDIILNIPIVIFIGDVVFVCEKPKCLWENAMLHSDQKPAIGWNDGTGFYFLDGVRFEKDLWEKVISQTMSFKEIMAIEISDQRTVALKYNPQAIIKENAVLVHKDERNNELYLIENQELNKDLEFPKIWFLKMTCPTGRVFVEGCSPDVVESIGADATKLQAYACGLTLSEYHSLKMES